MVLYHLAGLIEIDLKWINEHAAFDAQCECDKCAMLRDNLTHIHGRFIH